MNEIGIKTRILLMTLVPCGLLALVLGGYFSWQQLQDLEQQLVQFQRLVKVVLGQKYFLDPIHTNAHMNRSTALGREQS